MIITAGSTDVSVYYYIVQDASAASPGEPVTGLLFSDIETGGSASYVRQGAARVDLTLITLASASATHADGGFILVDDTNMPGVYRCDYPDAAFITGVDQVTLSLVVASAKNAVASPIFIDITDVDLRDSVRGGMTALPNAVADGAGGLPVSDLGGLDLDATVGALTYTVANQLDSNILSISGDTTAADNLELQYDTTGLVGDTFPSTQVQVGLLSVGSASISVIATAFVKSGAEPETNTFTSTRELDSIFHIVEDVATATEAYYEFDVGGNGVPVEVVWEGYAQSNGDSYQIFAFNFGTTSYEQIGTITGTNGTTLIAQAFIYTTAHVGTGANLGKVRFRFLSSDGTAFATDRLICSFAVIQDALGFVGGAVWYDNVNGETGTAVGIGTITRPSSVIADARTIADSNNLKIIHSRPGSTITLAATFDDFELIGANWTLALGGQQIANTMILGATVSGVATGANPLFVNCMIGTTTLPPSTMENCGLTNTITSGSAGDYFLDQCHSSIAGAATPVFDLGAALLNSNINLRHYSGGIELQNIGSAGTDKVSLEGDGQWVLNANCVGGTFDVRGNWQETDNSATTTVTRDQNSIDSRAIILDTADMQPKLGTPAVDVSADIAAVKVDTAATLVDTAQIGVAGAGLTDLGGMSTAMKAEVNVEADTALVDYDAATGTELAATEAKIDIIDTNVDQIETTVITNAAGVDIAADIIAVKAETAAIVTDTAEIGPLGAGLTDLGGMSAAMQTEIEDVVWDAILTGATRNIANSAGKIVRQLLEGGFARSAVWIDTSVAPGGDGTVTDPVDNITAALVVAAATGFRNLEYVTGSSDTFVAAVDGFHISGFGYTLALGGQSISGTRISNGMLSGICTGAAAPEFRNCAFLSATLPPCTIKTSSFGGSIILGAGDYFWDGCYSAVAGTGAPDFDLGAVAGNTNISYRHYSGGVELKNMGATGTDNVSLEGWGQWVLNANCVGGTFVVRGDWSETDNSSTTTVVRDQNSTDSRAVILDTNELQTDWANGGRLDLILDAGSLKIQLTEGYAADGVAPTAEELLFLVQQSLHEFAISSTTRTVKKMDGATTAATFTLDDATNPTSTTRTT